MTLGDICLRRDGDWSDPPAELWVDAMDAAGTFGVDEHPLHVFIQDDAEDASRWSVLA